MTEQEQKTHAQMVARKAAAFDWYAANGWELRPMHDGEWVCETESSVAFGPTPLEAVEAAMESEAQHDPR